MDTVCFGVLTIPVPWQKELEFWPPVSILKVTVTSKMREYREEEPQHRAVKELPLSEGLWILPGSDVRHLHPGVRVRAVTTRWPSASLLHISTAEKKLPQAVPEAREQIHPLMELSARGLEELAPTLSHSSASVTARLPLAKVT